MKQAGARGSVYNPTMARPPSVPILLLLWPAFGTGIGLLAGFTGLGLGVSIPTGVALGFLFAYAGMHAVRMWQDRDLRGPGSRPPEPGMESRDGKPGV